MQKPVEKPIKFIKNLQTKGKSYPITHTEAVIDGNGKTLPDLLEQIQSTIPSTSGDIMSYTDSEGNTRYIASTDDPSGIVGGSGITVLNSIDELPTEPTTAEQKALYLIDTTLYHYVGEGGDTLDGLYQSTGLEGEDGKSAYQSYIDTTTDDPVKTETEWVASLKGANGVSLGDVEIADNLTTDDATKVLSAKQGKVLNEKIENTTAVDLSQYSEVNAWVNNSGKWEITYKGKFIPIADGSKNITILGHATEDTVYALLTTNEHPHNGNVSFATGCTKTRINAGTTAIVNTIPSDAKFVWIGTYTIKNISPQALSYGFDMWSKIDVLDDSVQSLQDDMEELQGGNTLFIGNVVQQGYNASGLTGLNNKRATTETSMVVPKEAATIKFKFPDWLQCAIREGKSSDNLNTHNYYFRNGDTHTFLATSCWFRMCFTMLDDTQDIPVADVQAAIASGELKIYVEGEHSNIIERNAESEVYVKVVMRPFISGQGNNSGFNNYPVFAHTSDVHGDATRFNSMMDYCDYIGVDACLVSGDMVGRAPADSMQYINDVADAHNTMVLPCMGNHDARTLTTAQSQYDTIMKHLVEKNEVTTNPSETYPTYYYKDFASKKIRVIALNIYEGAHTSDNSNFTQAQCEWFVSTLASTPQGYGVIVMFHSPLELPTKDNDHATFYQDIVNIAPLPTNITGNPFSQIVDAFIGKSTATISYSIGSTSISVSADFTGVASGVEFIAYVNGHFHIDHIGYTPNTTHKQLCINVICGIGLYGGSTNAYYADISDIPRGLSGTTQDAFNLYVVDRATKSIRVARVGSNVAGNLTERKYMVIPYAD